jgi:hypothetical protein
MAKLFGIFLGLAGHPDTVLELLPYRTAHQPLRPAPEPVDLARPARRGVAGMAIVASLDRRLWCCSGSRNSKLLRHGAGFSVDRSAQTVLWPCPPSSATRPDDREGIVSPCQRSGRRKPARPRPLCWQSGTLNICLLVIVIVAGNSPAVGRRYTPHARFSPRETPPAGSDLSIAESACTDILQQALNDPQPASVLYSIEVLRSPTQTCWLKEYLGCCTAGSRCGRSPTPG